MNILFHKYYPTNGLLSKNEVTASHVWTRWSLALLPSRAFFVGCREVRIRTPDALALFMLSCPHRRGWFSHLARVRMRFIDATLAAKNLGLCARQNSAGRSILAQEINQVLGCEVRSKSRP